ncbi:MAG TPA: AMP-binding protein [Mycobacterium sp.]|nr:AMP-binding protein [Mycobacterium sp.]
MVVPADFGVDRFTIPAVLDRRAAQLPDRVMMSVAGRPITFAELARRSRVAAGMLFDLGLRRGDCVALFTGTCPEWIYFWLGAARIGVVSAAVNAANKGDFLRHTLASSRAKVVITDADRLPRVHEVADRLATMTDIVVCDDSLRDTLTRDDEPALVQIADDADETAVLFFTSGTTGPAKAVATTWHYLFTVAATVASAWEFAAGETVWTAMPLFHLSAAPTVLAPMLVGGTTVLADGFHPDRVWDDVRSCGAVGFAGAGAMVAMLQALPDDPRDRQLPLRFISAAPIAAGDYRAIEKRYGCRVVTMYGLTEAFPIAVKGVTDDGVPGTSGQPTSSFDVRIIDANGDSLPAGQVGEITCRPRHRHVMSEGYLGEDGRVALHQEWFRTGDLGKLDAAQNLTYVDRAKDAVRRRGENVSSIEVETAVLGHPAVAEAAVIGVPSELGEEDILLIVALRPAATLDRVELLDFCSDRMPYFCVPRYVEVVDEIPKNIVGRVRKDLLRARGVGAGTWDRERHGYSLNR